MYIAEEHSDCYFHPPMERTGPLALGNEGYHVQFQIINYSKQPIYVIDSDNRAHLAKTGQHRHGDAHVRIYHRSFNGINKIDDNLFDGTRGVIREVEIPLSLLQQKPVYVSLINMVLCIDRDNSVEVVHHPQSKEARYLKQDEIIFSAQDVSNASPFILAANDPSGKIKELFVEVNGTICSCAVTAYAGIHDTVVLSHRIGSKDQPANKSFRTTFTELMKKGPNLWDLNGVRFSTNYNVLQEAISLTEVVQSDTLISKKDYDTHIEILGRNHSIKFKQLEEEKGLLRDQITALTEQIELMLRQGYSDESRNLEINRLEFQKDKLEADRDGLVLEQERLTLKLEAEARADAQKIRQEAMNTLVSYGKVIVAVASVAALAFKFLEPAKK